MGLASALSTALTGLTAAETTIDVVGNNLANSGTVGFKASEVAFASQFLQTMGLGSAPTPTSGGTNPKQTGLGTMVAEITPDFNQGTIEISSSPLDMAIQGDGFFIVQGNSGENLYTRNGIFKLNSENEMTTITGNRVMGYGINDDFQIQRTSLVPLEIRLGGAQVAQATQNVYLEGNLTSEGTVADTAKIIQSAVLGDASYSFPDPTLPTDAPIVAPVPDITLGPTTATSSSTGGALVPGDVYYYKVVFCNRNSLDPPAFIASESMASAAIAGTVGAGHDTLSLANVPTDVAGDYHSRHIYRTAANPADPLTATYSYIDVIDNNVGTAFVDDGSAVPGGPLVDTGFQGSNYEYYITFGNASRESRPTPLSTSSLTSTSPGRIELFNLPAAAAPNPDGWNWRKIYRNLNGGSTFYEIETISDATTAGINYTDSKTDASIEIPANVIDFNGPPITNGTYLTDVVRYDIGSNTYIEVFDVGELEFIGQKGSRTLSEKEFTIDANSVMSEVVQFMEESMGIQVPPGPDVAHVIPNDITGVPAGGSIDGSGRVVFVSNNGTDNAVEVLSSSMKVETATTTLAPNMGFSSTQEAEGTSTVTDFIAYDSLGMDINVRITVALESLTDNETTYRWFADSPQNQPVSGVDISVGTGLVSFDNEGNYFSSTNETMSIYRRDVPSQSPLDVTIDFSELSGLGSGDEATLAVSRQDGSAPGTLTSFIIGDDGTIRGVFSNGITRDLGQIRLARFTNPVGLQQKGQNLFAAGVNSGLPIEGDPGEQGIGSIVAGATELSNTDIGANLIDLILASTMYRGNTRVITTSQEMLEELLSLRR
ncbi:MAG: flagellar hook-basal body complex protein [Planctomycetota bacterium]|nr:flagellar hook-basal body complex protein [Planctomycetota bacterium]